MGEAAIQVARVSQELNREREERILARCRAGDWSEYGVLVGRYRRLVWAAVDAVLGADPAADDLVQEVFIRAYEKLGTFRGQSSFGSWLYRLARNHALSHLRRLRRRPRVTSLEEDREGSALAERLTGGDCPGEEYAAAARRQALDQLVSRLPGEHRAVINLYYLGELTYEGIAEALRLPLNTVKTRLRRARLRLSQSAREEGWS